MWIAVGKREEGSIINGLMLEKGRQSTRKVVVNRGEARSNITTVSALGKSEDKLTNPYALKNNGSNEISAQVPLTHF